MVEILQINAVQVDIGEVGVVREATLNVAEGEGVALLGANGAGKTTLISALAGIRATAAGRIMLDGADITSWSPERRVAAGVVLVPQGRMLFPELTVLENLQIGASVNRPSPTRNEHWDLVYQMFPRLRELANRAAGNLSGGEQQMVAVGRALLARPRVFVLDEPSLGLSPMMVDRLYAVLAEIRALGTAILLVEQLVGQALKLTDRAYVLQRGQLEYAGRSKELINSERFVADYFGQ